MTCELIAAVSTQRSSRALVTTTRVIIMASQHEEADARPSDNGGAVSHKDKPQKIPPPTL